MADSNHTAPCRDLAVVVERHAALAQAQAAQAARLDALERLADDLRLELALLKQRVAFYAAVGSAIGGVAVNLAVDFLRARF